MGRHASGAREHAEFPTFPVAASEGPMRTMTPSEITRGVHGTRRLRRSPVAHPSIRRTLVDTNPISIFPEPQGDSRIERTMAKTAFSNVDEYLATLPNDLQKVLRRVRRAIRNAVPDAEEIISYQIPAYRIHGSTMLYFAGWKEHFSLYPATGLLTEVLKEELAPYRVSKGTIRFPLSDPVPVALIEKIAEFRASEAAARAKAKGSVSKKR